MSDRHRVSLQSRIGAFGVKTGMIASDDEMIAVACEMFGIQAGTIDEAWQASLAIGKKERGRRARASRLRQPFARYFGMTDWSRPGEDEELDAEREERILAAKARASVKHLPLDDDRRVGVEAFLRRAKWSLAA